MIQSTANTIQQPPDLVLSAFTEDDVTSIRVQTTGSNDIDSISVREPFPVLGVESVAQHVLALDVLEAVLDEEAWLSAISTVLTPGGWLTMRIPLEGPTAWLDSMNLFRYTQDITGLGHPTIDNRQKEWRRHYRVGEMPLLLGRSGLVIQSMTPEGSPLSEVRQLGGLLWGLIARRDDAAEGGVRGQRDRQETLDSLPKFGRYSTHLTVVARRPH